MSTFEAEAVYRFQSELVPGLQSLFPLTNDWLGADIATSIPIPSSPGTSIWLWGDTLVGKLNADGTRSFDLEKMPRNSVSVVTIKDRKVAHRKHADEIFRLPGPNTQKAWLWPVIGQLLPNNVVIIHAVNTSNSKSNSFGFQVDGTTQITFPYDSDPNKWKVNYTQLSMTNENFTLTTAMQMSNDRKTLYILGQKKDGLASHAILARRSLATFDRLEFYYDDGTFGEFDSRRPLKYLFPDPPPESTLVWLDTIKQWCLLIIPYLDSRVKLRLSKDVTGPWSSPIPLLDIPPVWTVKEVFCYAPKMHLELVNSTNTFVWTFMCNSFNPDYLKNHTDVYVPIFVKTKMEIK